MPLGRLYAITERYLRACSRNENLLSEEDISDLTADVISAIWLKRDAVIHPERYARRVCRNRLIQFLSSKRRRMRLQHEWHTQHQPLVSPGYPTWSFTAERSGKPVTSRLALVRRSMSEADGKVRLILLLRHESGMTWPDIAELTGVSASSARMKEQRFRKRVRAAWEGSQKPNVS